MTNLFCIGHWKRYISLSLQSLAWPWCPSRPRSCIELSEWCELTTRSNGKRRQQSWSHNCPLLCWYWSYWNIHCDRYFTECDDLTWWGLVNILLMIHEMAIVNAAELGLMRCCTHHMFIYLHCIHTCQEYHQTGVSIYYSHTSEQKYIYCTCTWLLNPFFCVFVVY